MATRHTEPIAPLVSVTDHAVERYLQRVRGTLDPRPEIAGRVSRAWAEGRFEPGRGGAFDVRDRDLLFVVHHDRPRGQLVVVTVWDTAEARFRTEGRMGFMDKAKKMAEQAQEKIEQAQQQFNERQAGQHQPQGGPVTEYDSAGRPVGQTSPAPPPASPLDEEKPHGDPVAEAPAPAAAPGSTEPEAHVAEPAKTQGDPADQLPHAPKPPESAPGMTSGDPLAG